MFQDRMCGKGDCSMEAIGFIGKFGETRTTDPPVNTPPGTPISASYCAEHEFLYKAIHGTSLVFKVHFKHVRA